MVHALQLQVEGKKGILISGALNKAEIKELQTALNGDGKSKLQLKMVSCGTLVIVSKKTDLLSIINGGAVSDELRGKMIMPVAAPGKQMKKRL